MAVSCSSAEPSIPVCQEESGFYCCGDHRLHLDRCLSWIDTCKLNAILDEFESKNFSYQTVRNAMITKWETTNKQAPYDLDRRFPDRKTYLKFSTDVLNYVNDMLSSLHVRDRVNELLTAHPTLKLSDTFIDKNETQLSNASLQFKKSILAIKREIASRDSVYDREKFETDYGIKWTQGDIDCSKPVRDVSYLAGKRCCTFGDYHVQHGSSANHFFDARNPYNYRRRVNRNILSNIREIDTNALLPSSPFFMYESTANRVWRVEYDDFCVLTWTNIAPYENVDRIVNRPPTFSSLNDPEELVDESLVQDD